MFRRLALLLLTAAALIVAVPAGAAQAQSSSTTGCVVGTFDPIVSGLWAGVNLDFGGTYTVTGQKIPEGTSLCPPTSAPTTTRPTPSPTPTAGQPTPNNGVYAALGDSVAAGVGLPNVITVPSAETRCGRTGSAYPYQVAATLNLNLIHAACSGATAGDLFTVQRSGSPNLPPQLDAAFASGTPRLITITAGANDAHWVSLLQTCYVTNCATQTQTTLANAYLVALQAKLLVLFPNIQARSGNNPPQVIVTGYYNPVSPGCTALSSKITSEEITWMTGEVNALNQTIQDVTKLYPFVTFVPVNFSGHDVCAGDPWVQGLNDARPFHPTTVGQQAYAQAVLGAVRQ